MGVFVSATRKVYIQGGTRRHLPTKRAENNISGACEDRWFGVDSVIHFGEN